MSLADDLASIPTTAPHAKRGPIGSCEIYGTGTFEDWQAVDRRRRETSWAEAQKAVDRARGITTPIKGNHFIYHWKGKCRHFDHCRDQIEAAQAGHQ